MIPKSKTRKYLAADDKYKDISPLNIINYVNSYSTGAACPTCNTTNEKELIELALNKQTMIVFAAGNEGMVSPNIQSMLPRYDESLRSWITVGAFNPAYVTKSQDGSLNFESNKALSDFSNGFYGAESWGILAPGEDIYSAAIGKMDSQYDKKSGTSMAAPFVSGAAALVQEKFPDLNGRQIADVLLSTANKNVVLPKVILKTFTDKNKTQKHTIIVSGQDDKTGTNNDLIVGGTYTQSTDATLTLVFGESGNAKLNATNGYNIANGAKLTFTPQKNVFFTLAGNKISIDMGNMPKHNFKISKPISDGSLQFDIDVFSSAIIPSLKNEAYATPNTSSQFTHTIKSIRHSSTLDTFYQQAFGQLDSLDMSLSAYTKADIFWRI